MILERVGSLPGLECSAESQLTAAAEKLGEPSLGSCCLLRALLLSRGLCRSINLQSQAAETLNSQQALSRGDCCSSCVAVWSSTPWMCRDTKGETKLGAFWDSQCKAGLCAASQGSKAPKVSFQCITAVLHLAGSLVLLLVTCSVPRKELRAEQGPLSTLVISPPVPWRNLCVLHRCTFHLSAW